MGELAYSALWGCKRSPPNGPPPVAGHSSALVISRTARGQRVGVFSWKDPTLLIWDLDVEQIQVVLTFLELLMILIIITNLNWSSNMFYQYHLSFYNLLRYHLNDGYLPYLSLYNFLSSHSYCHLPFNLLMTRWWAFTMWLLRPCRCHDAISADIRFFGQFFFPGKLPEKEVTVAGSGQFRGNSKKKGSRFWEKFLWKVPGRFSVE